MLLATTPAQQASAAINVLDASGTVIFPTTPRTISQSFTADAGADAIVVELSDRYTAGTRGLPASLTWGTVTLTRVVQQESSAASPFRDVAIYYAALTPSATSTTNTVTGSIPAGTNVNNSFFSAFALSGVNTAISPLTGAQDNNGASNAITINNVNAGSWAATDYIYGNSGDTNTISVTGSPPATLYQSNSSTHGANSVTMGYFNAVAAGNDTFTGSTSGSNASTSNPFAVMVLTATPTSGAWVGGGTNNWNDATQWNPNYVPNNAGFATTFGNASATGTVNLNAAETAGSITFAGTTATTISGANTLTIDSGTVGQASTITVSGATNAINSNITLNSNLSISTVANSQLTLGGNIGDGGHVLSLSTSGAGTVVLSGANTYSGGTMVGGGTLRASTGSLGSSGNISFTGGSLQYASGNTTDLSSRLKNSTSAINLDLNGNNVTYGAVIDNTNTGGLNLSSTAAGATLILGNANTFTGAVNINSGGTLQLNNANSVQNNTVTVNTNNTLTFGPGVTTFNIGALSGNANIAMTNTASNPVNLVVGGNGASTTYGGNISGGGTFTKTGSGTMTLAGAQSYAGPYYVTGGTLALVPGAPGLWEGLVANGTNSLDTTDPIPHNALELTTRYANINGPTQTPYSAGSNVGWPDNSTIGYSGYFNNSTGAPVSYTFNGEFDDRVYLKIDGQVIIADTNWNQSNAKNVTLSPGVHSIDIRVGQGGGGVGPLNTQGWTYNFGVGYSTDGGATYHSFTDPGDGSLLRTGPVIGSTPSTAQFVLSSNTTLDLSSASNSIGSIIDATGPTPTGSSVNLGTLTLTTGNDNLNTTFSGAFVGNGGSLNKVGSGIFTMAGVSTYNGATTVSNGVLRLASGSGLGATAISVAGGATLQARPNTGTTIVSSSGSSLALTSGSIFDMSGDSQAGTLSVGGGLSIANGATLNFDVGTNGSTTVTDALVVSGVATDTGTSVINITGFGSHNLSNGAFPLISAASGLLTGSFTLGNSTVSVNGTTYSLALVPTATQELLRITAPATSGNWIQTQASPPTFSWGDGTNWQNGTIPGAPGDSATFAVALAGNQTVGLDQARSIGNLTFNSTAGNLTVAGNGFTFSLDAGGAGAIVTNSTGMNLFSGSVNLNDNTIINAAAGSSLTFAGVVSGANKSLTINPSGSGTVALNNTNTFSGGLSIVGGVLQAPTINNASTNGPLGNVPNISLGVAGGGVGTLEYTGIGSVTSNMPITLVGGGGGILQVDDTTPTDALTLTGNITTSAPGTATLTYNGLGTLVLAGSANSFAGGLTINGGTLKDGSPAAATLGTASITFGASNTPTLDLDGNSPTVASLIGGSNALVTNSGGSLSTLTLNGSGSSTFGGPINQGASDIALTLTGGGTQVLTGVSTFGGGLNIQNGTVQIANGGTIGPANVLTLGSGTNGGTLVLGGSGGPSNVSITQLVVAGTGTNNAIVGGASTVSHLTITGAPAVTFSQTLLGGQGANQNNLALTYTGGSTLNLTGLNTYNGGTTVSNGGTLIVSALPPNSNPYGSGPFNLAGATLDLQGQLNAGLIGQFYNNAPANTNNSNPNFASMSAFTSHFASLSPTITTNLAIGGKQSLDYSNNGYGGNAPFNAAGLTTGAYGFTNNTNYETVFTGYIKITTPGSYTFATTSDDGSVLYLDGGDGSSPNDGGTLVSNNAYQGATRVTGTVSSLSAGYHTITIGFYQGGGGNGLLVDYSGPDTSNATKTIPMTVLSPNTSGTYLAAQTYSNALNVTGDSTINITNSLSSNVGAFSIGANTLNVTSSDTTTSPYSLTTGNATLRGNATINIANSSGGGPGTMTLGAVGDGGNNYSLTKGGPGTLVLSSPGTFGGGANISTGMVVANKPGSLGSGLVSLAGGTTLRVVANPSAAINGFNGGAGWATPNVAGGPFTPSFSGGALQITNANNNESTSVFYSTPQQIQAGSTGFTAAFTYQLQGGSTPPADGAAFILQNDPRGVTATGGGGGGLGFTNINPALGFLINIYSGHQIGTTLVGTQPAGDFGGTYDPTLPTTDFTNGDPIQVQLTYNPAAQTVMEQLVDANNNDSFSKTFTGINLASMLGNSTAYVGFSGGTGGSNANQFVSNFTYTIGSGGSIYGNAVQIAGGAISTIDVQPTATNSTVTMGTLTTGASASTTTLNVTAATAPANTSYGLTLGATTLNSNLAINVANNGSGVGTLTLGAVSGNFGLTVNGPGVVVLSGANTHSGNTTVAGGTLRLADGSTNNLVNSPLVTVAASATLDVTGLANGTISLVNGQTLKGGGAVHGSVIVGDGMTNNATIAAVSGGSFTIDGAAGLTINSGSTATFALGTPNGPGGAGLINITGGSLTVNSTPNAPTLALTGSLNSGTYDLFSFPNGTGPSSGAFSVSNQTGNNLLSYNLSYLANEIDLIVSNPAVSADWDFNGSGNFGDLTKWNPTGVPSGPGLRATFGNGITNVISGVSPITVSIGNAYFAGRLELHNTHGVEFILASDGVTGHGFTLNNNGSGAVIDDTSTAALNQISAPISLGDSQGDTINVTNASGTLDISGVISGSAGTSGLTKTGAGTVQIDHASTYTGPTNVNAGTLRTTSTGKIGSGALSVGSSTGATLVDLNNNQSVASLSGTVTSGGSATVQVEPGVTLSITGSTTATTQAGLTLIGSGSSNGGGALSDTGGGAQSISGATSLGSNSSVSVTGNNSHLTLASGHATIGSSTTATIGAGAKLTLAGSVSQLGASATGNVADRTHVVDYGSLEAATSGQVVGAIDGGDPTTLGDGSITVDDNATLQANLVQIDGSLTIGNNSIFAIGASDASGNPAAESSDLAGSGASGSSRLAALLASRHSQGSSSGAASSSASVGTLAGTVGSVAAVPEPSTAVLLALGAIAGLAVAARRRRMG